MLGMVVVSSIILILIVIIHLILFLINRHYKTIFEEKARLASALRITPERDKGENFEPFGIYDPIMDYVKASSRISLIVVITGIILTAITLFCT